MEQNKEMQEQRDENGKLRFTYLPKKLKHNFAASTVSEDSGEDSGKNILPAKLEPRVQYIS